VPRRRFSRIAGAHERADGLQIVAAQRDVGLVQIEELGAARRTRHQPARNVRKRAMPSGVAFTLGEIVAMLAAGATGTA